jgi:nitrite reductase/ring-hydroxylating ferredoxin subunit
MPDDVTGEPKDTDLWVICESDTVKPGGAVAFNLERVTETGGKQPFPIVIARTVKNQYHGYVNACPHEGTVLNFFKAGEFFTPDGSTLQCGRHGATFQIDTGACVTGPCQGKALEPIKLTVANGEVCLSGVRLVEDDGTDPYELYDDTMEIMIHPD